LAEIKPPVYYYEDLRRKADEFLAEYHPKGTIPIPIEEIVDNRLRLDIVPMPGLHRLLDVDGFLTGNRKEIYVDELVQQAYPGRYRFTLAHELGHYFLHEEVYKLFPFDSIGGWKEFHNSISEQGHSWFEYHGYAFGGLVLVPHGQLMDECQRCVELVRQAGLDLARNWDFAWDTMAAQLAKRFDVSTAVIDKRLAKDGIPDLFR